MLAEGRCAGAGFLLAVAACTLCGTLRADPLAYITDQGSDDVAVIDLASGVRVAAIRVGHAPVGVAVLTHPHRVFVSNPESHDVSVIERGATPREDRVIARLAAGASPLGIEVDETAARFYVSDMSANRLLIFDALGLGMVGTVDIGRGPGGIAVDGAAGRIYVADRDDNAIAVVDARTLERRADIPVGEHPFGLAIDATAKRLYSANVYANTVSVVDLAQGRRIADIAVGNSPYCLLLHPGLHRLYVSNQHADTVSIIDTDHLLVLDTVATGGYPEGMALHPDGHTFYVVNWMDDALSEHDAGTGRLLRSFSGGHNNRGFGQFIAAH